MRKPPPSLTPEELAAIDAYTDRLAADAPPPPPELIARLRPIFASTYEKQTDAA